MKKKNLEENLFFVVSGEHPTLPSAEVKAILEAEGFRYRVQEESLKLFRARVSPRCLDEVSARSTMFETCGIEIFKCENDLKTILDKACQTDFTALINSNESFAVRVMRIGGASKHLRSVYLEREIGSIILNQVKSARISLGAPSKSFLGIINEESFLLGLVRQSRRRGILAARRPRKRPFFHPATMPPKLARCMVNLARPRKGDILLDPFCGAGGLLIEAGLIGCRIAGCDVSLKMVRGSSMNLKFFNIEPLGVFLSDARKPPLVYAERIVTDPPYGRGASTLKTTTESLLQEFLPIAYGLLPRMGFMSIASPKSIGVAELAKDAGFELVERHYIHVHRSLTREIAVLRRK